MIADDLDAWAERLTTLALPADVIAAEARALAVVARQEAEKFKEHVASLVIAHEREIAALTTTTETEE